MTQHSCQQGTFTNEVTEQQAKELAMFRATRSYENVNEALNKAFGAYLGSDTSSVDEPFERQSLFEAFLDLQKLLRVLL